MAILDLPESILASLSNVLTQLQHVLPQPKQPTDFSAIAFKWENQELIAIQQPKKMYLEDLKGIERQKDKIIQNTLQFLNGLPANDVLLTGGGIIPEDDMKKLIQMIAYIRDTINLPLTLGMTNTNEIRWWVDASFGTRFSMRSQTGATLSFGIGSLYSMSRKQKLNTTSSTEAEIVVRLK